MWVVFLIETILEKKKFQLMVAPVVGLWAPYGSSCYRLPLQSTPPHFRAPKMLIRKAAKNNQKGGTVNQKQGRGAPSPLLI